MLKTTLTKENKPQIQSVFVDFWKYLIRLFLQIIFRCLWSGQIFILWQLKGNKNLFYECLYC